MSFIFKSHFLLENKDGKILLLLLFASSPSEESTKLSSGYTWTVISTTGEGSEEGKSRVQGHLWLLSLLSRIQKNLTVLFHVSSPAPRSHGLGRLNLL